MSDFPPMILGVDPRVIPARALCKLSSSQSVSHDARARRETGAGAAPRGAKGGYVERGSKSAEYAARVQRAALDF